MKNYVEALKGEQMKKYLKLMRVKHWIKNGLVFLPVIFGKKLLELDSLKAILLAFLSFSFAASIIYIINDLNDIESDKKHPTKCKRPLASGEISKRKAYFLICFLVIIMLLCCYFIETNRITLFILLFAYIGINLFYSLRAKNIPLLDLFLLVVGYIIRIYFGSTAIHVLVSPWLYLTVIFMAFFLSLGKRRNEILQQGVGLRKVLKRYTHKFLDKNMYMCLGLTIVFYSLWCEEMNTIRGNSKMLLTVPLVVLICMKYSLSIEGERADGDPTEIFLQDKILMALVVLYGTLILIFIY